MVVNCFKQALYLPEGVTQKGHIVGVSEVRNVDVRTNLNYWVALQGLTDTLVGNVVEEGS